MSAFLTLAGDPASVLASQPLITLMELKWHMRFRFRHHYGMLASVIAGWIGRLVGDWIYFPNRSYRRPQPAYGPAQAMRAQNKHQEALAYLQQLAKDHPGLAKPYVEMMDIADRELNDQKMVQDIFQQGLKKLKRQEKQILEEAYQEIIPDSRN